MPETVSAKKAIEQKTPRHHKDDHRKKKVVVESKPEPVPGSNAFSLVDILVLAFYVLAVLLAFSYSSNFFVSVIMIASIVGAALLLDAQMAVYVTSGVVGLVMAIHYMNTITSVVESAEEAVVSAEEAVGL